MRIIQVLSLVAIGVLSAGCYTLEPAGGVTPQVGTGVAFDLNDAGRVAMGGSMGPEIAQIEGRLVSKDATGYQVAVTMVRLLRGGEQVWHGEQIDLKSDYVSTVYLRQYSPGRTIAMSAIAVGTVVALAGAAIIGSGGLDDPVNPKDTSLTSRRAPRPRKLPPRLLLHPFPPTTP